MATDIVIIVQENINSQVGLVVSISVNLKGDQTKEMGRGKRGE